MLEKNLILLHYVPTRISMYFEGEGKITYVPLAASCITFWYISHASQFCIARALAEGTLFPITNEENGPNPEVCCQLLASD